MIHRSGRTVCVTTESSVFAMKASSLRAEVIRTYFTSQISEDGSQEPEGLASILSLQRTSCKLHFLVFLIVDKHTLTRRETLLLRLSHFVGRDFFCLSPPLFCLSPFFPFLPRLLWGARFRLAYKLGPSQRMRVSVRRVTRHWSVVEIIPAL